MTFSKPIKVIVVGDTVVGKTSVISNYIHGTKAGGAIATVGVDYYKSEIMIDTQKYQLQVFDTAGQDRFRSISVSYFRRADAILLFFSIDSRDGYDHVQNWAASIDRTKSDANIPVILIGNKADLAERRAVMHAEAEELARSYGWPYCETSALTGEGVAAVFELAAREVIQRRSESPAVDEPVGVQLPDTATPQQKTKRCC
jgi:small GTP-binding protein